MFPTVLPETIATGQVHTPVGRPLVTVCGWASRCSASPAHTRSCVGPGASSRASGHSACGGHAQCQESCSVERPQAAVPARWRQLFPNSGSALPDTPPPGSVSKPRRKDPLQPADRHRGGSRPARAHIPQAAHSPASSPGRPWVPLLGPTERKPGKCRRRQPSSQASLTGRWQSSVCGSCWGRSKPGMASEPPKDFLSHLHPRRLLFPESELHAFRKAPLTCEITFRAGDIPGGRVILWLEKGNVATN